MQPVPRKMQFFQQASLAWGSSLPHWVALLALECDRSGLRGAARKLGCRARVLGGPACSAASISVALQRGRGDSVYGRARALAEATLMLKEVPCPANGPLTRDACLLRQSAPVSGGNAPGCAACAFREGK